MNFPTQLAATPTNSTLDDLRDLQEVLLLLSVAMAVIASPITPIIVARVTAVIAQHTATAWAELLNEVIDSNGGER